MIYLAPNPKGPGYILITDQTGEEDVAVLQSFQDIASLFLYSDLPQLNHAFLPGRRISRTAVKRGAVRVTAEKLNDILAVKIQAAKDAR